MWHCPHCGTPQAETARCWVCRRSSTTCSTCRHFRRAVAPGMGYCGLDRSRRPLRGDELRGCWEGETAEVAPVAVAPAPPPSRLRTFVPLEELTVADAAGRSSVPAALDLAAIARVDGLTATPTPTPTAMPTSIQAYERGTLFDLDGGCLEPAR